MRASLLQAFDKAWLDLLAIFPDLSHATRDAKKAGKSANSVKFDRDQCESGASPLLACILHCRRRLGRKRAVQLRLPCLALDAPLTSRRVFVSVCLPPVERLLEMPSLEGFFLPATHMGAEGTEDARVVWTTHMEESYYQDVLITHVKDVRRELYVEVKATDFRAGATKRRNRFFLGEWAKYCKCSTFEANRCAA
jgi:hypothetical protein